MKNSQLVKLAFEARENAYTPYSNFKVGAALLTEEGKIYQGANIENAAYSPTNCAERTAFFNAVYSGERNFSKIAIVGGNELAKTFDFCAPCGVCRQVMREFCDDDFEIILALDEENIKVYKLSELLPQSFGPSNL